VKPPLLIQIELVGSAEVPVRPELIPLFSALERAGRPLVLIAERPDRWTPTRNRVDRAFMRQATIEAEIRRGGGALDAILYLDAGLFGRRRQREREFRDLAERYGCTLDDLRLLCRPGRLAEDLREVVGRIDPIDNEQRLATELRQLIAGND